jgi:acid stress chaperone HdeB
MRGFALCLLTALFATATAEAQVSIDLTKITCKQFLFDKIAPTKTVAIFMSGYYNGVRHNTVIDMSSIEKRVDQVEDYCRLNLETPLMDAVQSALGLPK